MNLNSKLCPFLKCISRALYCNDSNVTCRMINHMQTRLFNTAHQRLPFDTVPSETNNRIFIRSKSKKHFNIKNLSENIRHNKTYEQLKLKFVSVEAVIKNSLNINRK